MKIIKVDDLEVIFDADLYSTILTMMGWSVIRTKNFAYVVCTKKGYYGKRLHRVLTNCPDNLEVDHINGNTLDNRLCNLRLCTSSQNKMNTERHKDKLNSLPKGVVWRKDKKKFNAKICINYTNYHLGYFKTVEEAEVAYKKAAEKWQKEFALHLSRKD
jgi:hypothetical protein